MSTKQQEKQHTDQANQARSQRDAVIGRYVMRALGQPEELRSVQVRPLWGNHYRVNIFIGENVGSAKIVNSYFVSVDDDGNIIDSTPKIARVY
jgi:hypothetical protein